MTTKFLDFMFFKNPNGTRIPQAYPAGSATGRSGTRMRADRMTVRASQGARPPTRRLFSSLPNLRVRDLPFPGGPAGERSARVDAHISEAYPTHYGRSTP
jgi:hypothetical protein